MNEQRMQMFKELTETPGVSGFEHGVREVMTRYITPYADEVYTDNLGSLIAKKQGAADMPKVMIAGHLDEIGFMVTQITDKGFLRFQTLGGWWEQVMLAQRVTIYTRKGIVEGVIGSKPPHIMPAEERKKPVEKEQMFIDIGASDRAEAEEWGIRPGDPVLPYSPFTVMNNPKIMMAKAWDNRIGCAVAIEVLQRLQGEAHPNTVYGVGTVQEEVGPRGAITSASLIDPDVAFAIDVGIAGDTPGLKEHQAVTKIGGGPQLLLYDASLIAHRGLRDLVIETAEQLGIPYQLDIMSGGLTDAGKIQLNRNGVPSMTICIPTRYIHSHAGLLHMNDFEQTVTLLVEVVKRLDWNTVQELKK